MIWIIWFQLKVISVTKWRKPEILGVSEWFWKEEYLQSGQLQYFSNDFIKKEMFVLDLIYLPIIFSPMLCSTTNRIGRYTIRTRCNIVRLQTVAVQMLNGIFTAAVQAVTDHHTRRAIESIFQIVADQTEIRQSHPTRFHRTRTGHTVTFALLTHFTLYMLKRTDKNIQINKMSKIQHSNAVMQSRF